MEKLKKSMASGASWGGISALATTVLQLAQLFVLTSLLEPSEFGIMAMAMVVTAFMQTVADLGVGSALIYRQDTTQEQTDSLCVLTVVVGILGFLAAVLSTPLCVWFFREDLLFRALPLCAITFLIMPFGQTHVAILQRALRFRSIAVAEMLSQVAGFIVAVTLAWRGHGVFALIWALLASLLLRTALLNGMARSLWRPRWRFRRSDLRGFLGFGLYQTASGIVNYVIARVDVLMLGRLLGPAVLGQYNFAFNLAMQPITRINPILTRVAFPVFSSVQDDTEKLKKGFFLVSRLLLTLNAPLLLGLASVMGETIGLVFDDKWQPSVAIVEIMALVALFRSMVNPVGSLLLARGRADLEFRWNILVVCLQIPAVWLGARLGAGAGVAGALLVVQVLLSGLVYGVLIRSTVGPCLGAYLRNLAGPILPAGAMALAIFLIPDGFPDLGRAGHLIFKLVLGAVLYLTLLLATQRTFVRETVAMFRKR
jgi:O-antigen/teichoic acid export membrane protein